MAAHETRILHLTLETGYEAAYRFASQPSNFPKWAAGMSTSLHHTAEGLVAQTPQGEAKVIFSEVNAFGVLDQSISLPGKPDVYVPLRMIRNGNCTEAELTLFRQPEMTDAIFEQDVSLVMKDLHKLGSVLRELRNV